MAWYSILPPELTHLESWVVSFFVSYPYHRRRSNPFSMTQSLMYPGFPQFFLGVVTIGPWAFLVLLDATIWIYRMIIWDFPWIGGRARGRQRPRAPSLNARPGGQRRAFGLRGVETDTGGSDGDDRDWGSDPGKRTRSDSRKNDVSPVRRSIPHASGGGILKRRSSGQL
ncbi:unnamed protein product [Penicillium salamii]|nr:unnamed protein product [Penicillium salamii]